MTNFAAPEEDEQKTALTKTTHTPNRTLNNPMNDLGFDHTEQFEAMLDAYPNLHLDTTMVIGGWFERQPDLAPSMWMDRAR